MLTVLPKFKLMQKLTDRLNGVTRENLTGIRVVRAYNAEEYQEEKFDKVNGDFTKTQLFTGTVADNINFGGKANREEVIEAAKIAEADGFINEMEEGYDSPIAQGGKNVSGGQKQRISIARAVAAKPEIMIFDDSFSALDYKTDKKVRQNLKDYLGETTNLIVAQRIGTIMDADKIIVLDKGKAVGEGTHAELLKTCDVYREIALSQLSKEELGL